MGLAWFSVLIYAASTKDKIEAVASNEIVWHSLEDAVMLNKKNPKPILIDIYTDWCKWCHVMDEKTYQNPEVVRYVNDNFYAVKLNAEQKTSIQFKGQQYDYVAYSRRGVHGVVPALIGPKLSYPSTVMMDKNLNIIEVLKGYQD